MARPKKNITIDQLAAMVQEGFDEIVKDVKSVKEGQVELKNGQEEIKLKLDRVAYRFEVEELQRRVEILEHKVLRRRFVSK